MADLGTAAHEMHMLANRCRYRNDENLFQVVLRLIAIPERGNPATKLFQIIEENQGCAMYTASALVSMRTCIPPALLGDIIDLPMVRLAVSLTSNMYYSGSQFYLPERIAEYDRNWGRRCKWNLENILMEIFFIYLKHKKLRHSSSIVLERTLTQ